MRERPSRAPRLDVSISVALVFLGIMLTLGIGLLTRESQRMIESSLWPRLLQASTSAYFADPSASGAKPDQNLGALRQWRFRPDSPPAGMPPYFARLSPGYYDEHELDKYDATESFAALITRIGDEHLVMAIDLTELENDQNRTVLLGVSFVVANLVLIAAAIIWLNLTLRRPVQELARRMDQLDPDKPSQRLPVGFAQVELRDIAIRVNLHLERVERFIERERSLLDQASHEFRTPIAVIAGAVDVLRVHSLPAAAAVPLERIGATVEGLNEIMSALLYLSRESLLQPTVDSTRLDELLPRLVEDHEHLAEGRSVSFSIEVAGELIVRAPVAMVRIVVGNLLRNAVENTLAGVIAVRLEEGRLTVSDPGRGFDTAEAARVYATSLRTSVKPGGGLGLGLFLVRRICDRFGWTLAIDSTVSQGTRAMLTFGEIGGWRR